MNRLKELRKEKKLTQEELASEIGVSKITILRWENGERQIKPDKAQALAEYFGVSVGYLLGYSDFISPNDFLKNKEIVHHESIGDIVELKAEPIELLLYDTIGEKRIDEFYDALVNIANTENKKFGLGRYSSKEEAMRDITHLVNNIFNLPEEYRKLLVFWSMGTQKQKDIIMETAKEFANTID